MKIQSLKYEDLSTGWKLDLTEFNPHLTLLVGVSGVGKTRILRALLNLKEISQGNSLNEIKWIVTFIINNQNYGWSGVFENKGSISNFVRLEDEEEKFTIENETLYVNNKLIIERTDGEIIFNGNKTVKLSQHESIVSLLKEEEMIKPIYEDFSKIIFDKHATENTSLNRLIFPEPKSQIKRYKTLDDIRNCNANINIKLFYIYINNCDIFKKIVSLFIEIFPYVEEIKIGTLDNVSQDVPSSFRELPFIQIKEKQVENWIDALNMSSGMYRTLMLLAELYLCADETVILMDEFENSLGINCINEVTSSLLTPERNLQFIITSHHPYIINNTPIPYWKVVTRNGNVVKTTDAEKLGVGRSKHQAFTQLANLEEYSKGIES